MFLSFTMSARSVYDFLPCGASRLSDENSHPHYKFSTSQSSFRLCYMLTRSHVCVRKEQHTSHVRYIWIWYTSSCCHESRVGEIVQWRSSPSQLQDMWRNFLIFFFGFHSSVLLMCARFLDYFLFSFSPFICFMHISIYTLVHLSSHCDELWFCLSYSKYLWIFSRVNCFLSSSLW